MAKEIMDRAELCEFFGVNGEEFLTLFPAPPSFTLAGREKFRLCEIQKWLDETVKDQDEKKVILGIGLYKAAKAHLSAKRFEDAEKTLVEAIALDRTKGDYQFNLAFALYNLGKFDRAELSFRKALELEPKGEWRDAAKHLLSEIDKAKGVPADPAAGHAAHA